jgi:Spy/CpxP family protein refolding chaperone
MGDDTKKDPAPPPKAKGTLPAGWRQLGLTDQQKDKIYKIEAEYRGKIDVLEQKIKELRKEQRDELVKVLTDAQKARLKEIREARDGKDTEPKKAESGKKGGDGKP